MENKDLVQAALRDWRSASLSVRVRAMLGFLDALHHAPESVTSADVVPLREAGLAERDIEDALRVAFSFHVITRLADAFAFPLSDEATRDRVAHLLLRNGYRGDSIPDTF